jgi:hypothetical protein
LFLKNDHHQAVNATAGIASKFNRSRKNYSLFFARYSVNDAFDSPIKIPRRVEGGSFILKTRVAQVRFPGSSDRVTSLFA